MALGFTVVEGIEDPEAERIDQRDRGREGHFEQPMGLGPLAAAGGGGREIATEQDAATEVLAACRTIHPGHGELMLTVRCRRQGEELVQVAEASALGLNPGARDGPQLDLHPGDEPGQTQAANSGGEPVGVLGRRAAAATSVGAYQFEGADMVAKGAGTVMVLAMHVVGHRPAQGHEAGAGGDGQKPALGDDEVEDLRQQDPGLGAQDALFGVEGDEPVQAAAEQEVTAVVETDIPIAAPIPEYQHRQVALRQRGVAVGQAGDLGRRGLGIAPQDSRHWLITAVPG